MRRGSSTSTLNKKGSAPATADAAPMVLTTMSVELPLPLGIGLTSQNVIFGAAAFCLTIMARG